MDNEIVKPPSLSMLESAINSGLEPDKLLKFYELHERHEANEARKAYVKAMAKFRGLCPSIKRTKDGYNSKYSGLAETLSVITGAMSECGLTHSWETMQEGNKIGVTCWLTHELGHREKTTLYAGADDSGKKSPIQSISSTVSYLERYTLFAILGLASSEMDNDGNQQIEYIDDKEITALREKMKEAHLVNEEKFLKALNVESIEKLHAKHLSSAFKLLSEIKKHNERVKDDNT